MKDFSVKKLILCLLGCTITTMILLTLFFGLISLNVPSAGYIENGFTFLSFKSVIFDGYFSWHLMTIVNGILSIIILLIYLTSVILVILSFFKRETTYKRLLLAIVIMALMATTFYAVMGIVDAVLASKYSYILNTYGFNFGTIAFIPLILIIGLTIGYFICNKVIPCTISKSKKEVLTEEERLSRLLKYKQLLNEEIITKEEFEEKKKELLFLEEKTEEPKVEKKKTAEDIKIETIMKYKKLFDEGIISQEEFSLVKKKML